jgi:hypothetical protein
MDGIWMVEMKPPARRARKPVNRFAVLPVNQIFNFFYRIYRLQLTGKTVKKINQKILLCTKMLLLRYK